MQPSHHGVCGDVEVAIVLYVTPGRELTQQNASFVAASVNGVIVLVVAYDEQDLSTAVTVYADRDGKGHITDIWPVDEAPQPCKFILSIAH